VPAVLSMPVFSAGPRRFFFCSNPIFGKNSVHLIDRDGQSPDGKPGCYLRWSHNDLACLQGFRKNSNGRFHWKRPGKLTPSLSLYATRLYLYLFFIRICMSIQAKPFGSMPTYVVGLNQPMKRIMQRVGNPNLQQMQQFFRAHSGT